MNKESSIKQLKRIKQEMTHADDVNALGFAIRFMENGVSEIEFDQLVFALATMYKAPENAPDDWEHHGEENLKAWKDYINTARKRGYIKE